MDAADITDLFAPVGRVKLRRMFGGHGIYLDGIIFALEADGMIWMKTDETNRADFERRGARAFVYSRGKVDAQVMSYWSLPETAFDDVDELRDLTRSALGAAGRVAAARKSTAKRRKPVQP
ncbi:MAG: TfoX/Sxy family protein [Beijerinckiaceae bacterium]